MRLYGSLFDQKIGLKFAVFLALILLFFAIGNAVAVLILRVSGDVFALKMAQLVLSTAIFVLPAAISLFLFSNFKFQKLQAKSFFYIFLLILLSQPIINLLVEINENLVLPDKFADLMAWLKGKENQAQEMTQTFLQTDNFGELLLNLLIMAVVPALGEELTFRGVLQSLFSARFGRHCAIWLSAAIFSFIHFQFFGFLPRMLLGAFFGYLVLWSGSLWSAIFAHFLNNALGVLVAFFYPENFSTHKIDDFGTDSTLWFSIVCVFLFSFFLLKLKKSFLPKPPLADNQ